MCAFLVIPIRRRTERDLPTAIYVISQRQALIAIATFLAALRRRGMIGLF